MLWFLCWYFNACIVMGPTVLRSTPRHIHIYEHEWIWIHRYEFALVDSERQIFEKLFQGISIYSQSLLMFKLTSYLIVIVTKIYSQFLIKIHSQSFRFPFTFLIIRVFVQPQSIKIMCVASWMQCHKSIAFIIRNTRTKTKTINEKNIFNLF